MKKVILTGGGTAGHISPILPLIDILKKNARIKYLYVGSRSGPEVEIAQKKEINFYGLVVGKRRNYISFSNFIDFFKIFIGLIQAYFLLIHFKPDVIFAKGGYVTFPILFWAQKFNLPVIIHESDAVMGRANVWASQFAKKICLGFPLHYYRQDLPKEKSIYTGVPVGREFYNQAPVKNEKPVILATGGSQGSNKINNCLKDIAGQLSKDYEVYHIAGKKDYQALSNEIKNEHYKNKFSTENYHLIDFTFEMADLINKADLVIARSGASSLAEIAALGKPAILIPLPSAHMDHQAANAKILSEKNAAVVISEKSLTSTSLLSIINHLMDDNNFRGLLGHHIREFDIPESSSQIVDLIYEELHGK